MTKEETRRRFQAWCQREIGNNCSSEDYAMFNNIMALLEQNTVSEEVYTAEYNARKQAEYELWKIKEQQPCDDCISRKAVIDSIDSIREHHGGMLDVRAVVTQLPSVTPVQNWIPIITREPTEEEKEDYFEQNGEELCYMIDSPMPDNGQEVLVSVGDIVGEDIFYEDFWNFEGWDIDDIDAWMPLPKPYE